MSSVQPVYTEWVYISVAARINRQHSNGMQVLPVVCGGLLLVFGIAYFYATRPIPPLPESVHESFTKLE